LTFINYQITYKEQPNDDEFFANARQIIDSTWSQLGYYKKQSNSVINANQLNKISDYLDQVQASFILNDYSYSERASALVMFLLVTM
jgi:hypothetical protein